MSLRFVRFMPCGMIHAHRAWLETYPKRDATQEGKGMMTTSKESDERVRVAANALRYNRVHGAMELALQAVDMAVELLTSDVGLDVRVVAQRLAAARPSM